MGAIASNREKLSYRAIFSYGAPTICVGYMNPTLTMLVMKFSTDVLLIAPVLMGLIFSASRIVDAVSDPIVGYLSDRTRSRFGRRRIWIAASILPLAGMFTMVSGPPIWMEAYWWPAWMAVAIIGTYIALTLFMIPHYALGAEIAPNYHEKSRLFGFRQSFWAGGSICAVLGLQYYIAADAAGYDLRTTFFEIATTVAAISIAVISISLLFLQEPKRLVSSKSANPIETFNQIRKNSNARLLLLVYFIDNIGFGAVGALTLYIVTYVIDAPHIGALVALVYFVPAAALVSLWIPLARRIGKTKLWVGSMFVTGISLGLTVLLPFLPNDLGIVILLLCVFIAGASAGCGGTMAPAILGDIVDQDELETGSRKDGTYFAALTFMQKSAYGVMLLIAGLMLQVSGFEPNAKQTIVVQMAMVSLFGALPFVAYITGAMMFLSGFRLDERAHVQIIAQLDERRRQE